MLYYLVLLPWRCYALRSGLLIILQIDSRTSFRSNSDEISDANLQKFQRRRPRKFSHCLLWDRISSDWRQWHDGEYLSYFHFKISLVFQSKFDLLHTWGAKKSSAFVFMYEIYSLLNNIIHNNILSVGYETSCSNINLYLPIQWQFMTDVFCLWSFKSITLSLIGDIGDLSSKQEQENLHILYENITYLLRLLKSFGLCKLFY